MIVECASTTQTQDRAKFEDMIAKALPDAPSSAPGRLLAHRSRRTRQVIMMWPYDSHAHREQVLRRVKKAASGRPRCRI